MGGALGGAQLYNALSGSGNSGGGLQNYTPYTGGTNGMNFDSSGANSYGLGIGNYGTDLGSYNASGAGYGLSY